MAEIIERINRVKKKWNLLGFITLNKEKVGIPHNGYPIVGTLDDLHKYPEAFYVPDDAWPRTIELPYDRLVSLIDPSTFVSRTAKIGVGCVIYPNCFIGLSARIGDYVFSFSSTVINHDDIIEDRVQFGSGVTLAGNVHVEPDCFLGQASTCIQKLTIGRNSLIGMGSVVVKNVEPYSVMAGNPAKKLRELPPDVRPVP